MAKKKVMIIAVDPGFDAFKVVVNGEQYSLAKDVVRTKEDNLLSVKRDEDFILSHYIEGESFFVGPNARKLLSNKNYQEIQNKKETADTELETRFTTQEFEVGIWTAIGYALIRYSKEHGDEFDIDEYNEFVKKSDLRDKSIDKKYQDLVFAVAVALPNDAMDEWASVKNVLLKPSSFSIETIWGEYEINLAFKDGQLIVSSQVVVAMLGELIDNEGNTMAPDDNMLPAIIIDGGYRTVGMFELSEALSVEDGESNIDYAMHNVNIEVASQLQAAPYNRSDIHSYNIEKLIEKKEIVRYKNKDGKVEEAPLEDIRNAVIEEKCNGLIDHLESKFNDLLDVKQIIIVGGTGSVYYPIIKEYIEKNNNYINVRLIESEMNGKEVPPVFAVAMGMYRLCLYEVKKQSEAV
ncbi:hypothetical protein [Butyrivibrio sp. MC2013]|uniref:hypothetical protein n=1 Tax=Butyrivibrio sp. MC2013 TaxID=1280686 RepID=UPI0004163607|nr:hypothetical protein [Butyrivibrio sp. MC2013]